MKEKLFALGILLAVFLAGCTSSGGISSGQGRAVFTMADAAADMGTVSSVKVTVDQVKVHSNAQGWVTASSIPRTYDLLQLKADGSQALLADAQLKSDTYDQVVLQISQVTVVDAQGSHTAKLPSNELKLKGDMVVEADATTVAKFDFIADESLHVTGNGKYIFAPVVKTEVKSNANVAVNALGEVSITGGKIDDTKTVGMDVDGSVKLDFEIPKNKKIDIDADNKIKIGL